MFFGLSEPLVDDRLDELEIGLYEILKIHSLPFAQIWIPYSQSGSSKVLYCAGASIYEHSSSMYHEFEDVSEACFIESGKALVGRAFASQGSCFCKDVSLLSFNEYPLVPSARKARLTQSFAIYLQSKCANNIVSVVEYFLPPNEMVVGDTKTFLNMLLSTMNEQLPGFIVASGKELGQRMLVEVVKVSLSDELDSFEIGQPFPSVQIHQDGGETTEIGQPLPSVQSHQDGGETTEIDYFCEQSNLQNMENNVAAALLVPSCSSLKHDSLNCERTVEDYQLLSHPIEESVTNKGTVNVDVAHDDHIEDTCEMMQLDSHFEQPNLKINYAGNARNNDKVEHNDFRYVRQSFQAEAINRKSNFASGATTNSEKIDSQKNIIIQRIEKDHGITHKILEQHYGMTLEDAAKSLHGKFTNFSKFELVSPSDEFDSFEIGQSLPSVQSLQDGGGTTEFGQHLLSVQSLQDVRETTEIDSFCQQSNNVVAAAALLVPSCSSDKRDSLNCGRTMEVDLFLIQ
ncbi:hypothetical protein RDI58_027260 [Solanum bulbocastanum]|uniref:NLP1-9 GAF domain-containing protein n=1 Tax=Solanum bulbocastanum TaxID=147425 RepID=A0AAN8Y1Y5_SOLBU